MKLLWDDVQVHMCFSQNQPKPATAASHMRPTLVVSHLVSSLMWCFHLRQSAGPVPCPQGLHAVPAGGGILPGPGSHRRRAAHAHACRGTCSLHLSLPHTPHTHHTHLWCESALTSAWKCSCSSIFTSVCRSESSWQMLRFCLTLRGHTHVFQHWVEKD